MTDLIHLDRTALRVLAHPLRSRLLSQLRLHGPATATELADQLVTNTGATSYHLRKLESVGLVVDTGEGIGKRRVWQASSRGHDWTPSEFADDDDSQESLTWLSRHYVTQLAERAEEWFQHDRDWPRGWQDTLGYGDDGVRVTPEQAAALRDDLQALFTRYRNAGGDDPTARDVLISAVMIPVNPRFERTS